jgi:hypothetical protein
VLGLRLLVVGAGLQGVTLVFAGYVPARDKGDHKGRPYELSRARRSSAPWRM